MSTPYIGEIRAVGFNFAPQGWAFCNGQSLAISEYDTLFALIGTTYGGDGQTTFNLPNLQSRLAVGSQGGAAGPGLSAYPLGVTAGTESVTLNTTHVPPHQHPFSSKMAAASGGTLTDDPKGAFPGSGNAAPYATAPGNNEALNPNAISGLAQPNPGSQPHNNIQPVLALNYIISLYGIFPPQQ
ncbi:phage tail protein [Hymenobacter jeollabukensis]|jgi:microcystin-dependent protein|uniref:Phage tail protein n=1 Tax=Hymenobacter jeollabukensis TaxID=2025313 RepID=A0A5R8WRX5_9BACT|nr:tail fiber protein [Hymenobacter jeollabukensis]TLM93931.1 phage tail protein [Hymenobacter jeollabukensis]